MTNELMERGYLTKNLGNAAHSGEHGLNNVPGLLRRALDKGAWKERIIVETGEEFKGFNTIEEYIEHNPPKGIGIKIKTLKQMIEEDKKLYDDFDQAIGSHQGQRTDLEETNFGVIHPEVKDNRDRSTKQLRRLRKDYPDLHAQVLRNEKTINEAAVEAGIYPARIAVNLNDAKSAASTLLTWGSPEFIAELRRLLNN